MSAKPNRLVSTTSSAALLIGLVGCVQPTNPFDPETPPGSQAPVVIEGRIQSVIGPVEVDGEPLLLEAASCPEFPGNHAGFEVILRGLGFDGETEGIRAASQLTEAAGLYRFENAPPGDYTIEFARPGFAVPPPISLSLTPGETVTVPTRCGLKTSTPARPLLGELPARTSEESMTISVQGCDADETVTTTVEIRSIEVSTTTVVALPDEAGECSTTFPLVDGNGTPLASYRVTALATDGLGNQSAVTERTVVYDASAPAMPATVELIASSSRVDIEWAFAPPVATDDGPAYSVVSYAVLPRDEVAGALCPFGNPTDDDNFDVAGFAAEGTSPLLTLESRQALTEIPIGTTVYVQVAGVDALGNSGCFSAPQATRVDRVTLLPIDPVATLPTRGTAVAAGTRADALGDAGLQLTASDGTTETIAAPALDVVSNGRTLFAPAGDGGLSVVRLDATGAVAEQLVAPIGPTFSIAKRPGVVIVGTDTGIRAAADVDLQGTLTPTADPGGLSAPVVSIQNFGRGLVIVRATQPARIQIIRRDDPSVLLGTVPLAGAPKDAIITGDSLFVALNNGRVQPISLEGCRTALENGGGDVGNNALGCLSTRVPVPLPAPADARRLLALDDILVVGAESNAEIPATGLYLLDIGGVPAWVGQAPLPEGATIKGLNARDLHVCAHTLEGNDDVEHCFDAFFLSRIAREQNLASGTSISDIQTSGASAIATEAAAGDATSFEPGVIRASIDTSSAARFSFSVADTILPGTIEENFPSGAPRALTLANFDGVGAISLDQYARLHFAHGSGVGAAGLEVLDDSLSQAIAAQAPSLMRAITAGNYSEVTTAFVEKDGEALIIAMSNANAAQAGTDQCASMWLARVTLTEDVLTGALSTATELKELGQGRTVTRIAIAGTTAVVSTAPFGLLRAPLTETLGDVDGITADCAASSAGQTAAFDLLRVADDEVWIAAQRDESGALVSGIFSVDNANVVTRLDVRVPGRVVSGTVAGDTLFVATANDGAYLVETSGAAPWFPTLALPNVRDPRIIRPTTRGFTVADGAFGATWFVLQ